MNIFVKAYFGNGITTDVPINESNTFTRCCCCDKPIDKPIQISLDFAVEGYLDPNLGNKSEYKSFSDYFNNGFICEECAEAEED